MIDKTHSLTLNQTEHSLAIQKLAKHFFTNALSPSTQKFYRIDFGIFSEWCQHWGHEWLPASPETVAVFLTDQANGGIKPATLVRRLAAIKMAHEVSNHQNPTSHPAVTTVLKGIKRTKGVAPDKKSPVTAERLETMVAYCPDSILGLRDKALLLLGFAGAFRRSEIVGLTMNDIERTDEGIKVTIRKSKGDQEGKGQTVAILNGTRFRVVDTLYMWLKQAGITEGNLFRAIRKGGNVQHLRLTDITVTRIVKKYASLAGLNVDKFSGHSLRSGFITSGAQAGSDLYKLMEVSRHKKPETVLGYVRESNLFENHAGAKFL